MAASIPPPSKPGGDRTIHRPTLPGGESGTEPLRPWHGPDYGPSFVGARAVRRHHGGVAGLTDGSWLNVLAPTLVNRPFWSSVFLLPMWRRRLPSSRLGLGGLRGRHRSPSSRAPPNAGRRRQRAAARRTRPARVPARRAPSTRFRRGCAASSSTAPGCGRHLA